MLSGWSNTLNHQDENFSNPPPPNQHPNQAHLDSFTSLQSGTQKLPLGLSIANGMTSDFENRSDWGQELRNNGHVALYERDFGGGYKLYTWVIWEI